METDLKHPTLNGSKSIFRAIRDRVGTSIIILSKGSLNIFQESQVSYKVFKLKRFYSKRVQSIDQFGIAAK